MPLARRIKWTKKKAGQQVPCSMGLCTALPIKKGRDGRPVASAIGEAMGMTKINVLADGDVRNLTGADVSLAQRLLGK